MKLINQIIKIYELCNAIDSQFIARGELLKRLLQIGKELEIINTKHSIDSDLKEQLDFLVFMQSKRIEQGGREVVVSGDRLFDEWKKAVRKNENLPNEQ